MAEKGEEQKNCDCKKPLIKAKRYYRNNRYYCNKGCWKKALAKAAEAKE